MHSHSRSCTLYYVLATFLWACLFGLVTDQEQHLSPLGGDSDCLAVRSWGCSFSPLHWESWHGNRAARLNLAARSRITLAGGGVRAYVRVCEAAAERRAQHSSVTYRPSYKSLNVLRSLVLYNPNTISVKSASLLCQRRQPHLTKPGLRLDSHWATRASSDCFIKRETMVGQSISCSHRWVSMLS